MEEMLSLLLFRFSNILELLVKRVRARLSGRSPGQVERSDVLMSRDTGRIDMSEDDDDSLCREGNVGIAISLLDRISTFGHDP